MYIYICTCIYMYIHVHCTYVCTWCQGCITSKGFKVSVNKHNNHRITCTCTCMCIIYTMWPFKCTYTCTYMYMQINMYMYVNTENVKSLPFSICWHFRSIRWHFRNHGNDSYQIPCAYLSVINQKHISPSKANCSISSFVCPQTTSVYYQLSHLKTRFR